MVPFSRAWHTGRNGGNKAGDFPHDEKPGGMATGLYLYWSGSWCRFRLWTGDSIFFAIYGLPGLWGALLAGLGFAIFGGMVYQISRRYQVRVYHEFLQLILGKRLGKIADYWLMTYLFGSLVVMLAGCRAIFQQHLEVPGTIGLGASLLIVYGALSCREEGVIAINWLLVPVMIFGILLVTLGKGPLMGGETGFAYPVGESRFLGWALSSLLYVSYNLRGLVVLVSINEASDGPIWGTRSWGLGLGSGLLITVFLQGHLGIIEE